MRRAVLHTEFGEPQQVLRLADMPDPREPPAGHVLVRVLSRPVHPGDLLGVRSGPAERAGFSRVPGLEGMGVVEAVGPGAAEALSDQRVAIFFPAPGAWSETVTVPASFVVPVPRGVADDTAALMLVNPITALTLLRAVEEERGGRGGLVVQTAAGSSVGRLLGAEALRRGIPMVNLVRSTAGARVLRQHQPELATISTADEDWRAQVRDAADGQEVRVVLDAVGGSFTADLIGLLADGSTLITYEQLGSGSTPLESLPLTIRELTVRGVSIGRWSSRIPEERAGDIGYATRLAVDAPELLGVAARYDLADFGQAIDHVSRPGRTGTVLLTSPLS